MISKIKVKNKVFEDNIATIISGGGDGCINTYALEYNGTDCSSTGTLTSSIFFPIGTSNPRFTDENTLACWLYIPSTLIGTCRLMSIQGEEEFRSIALLYRSTDGLLGVVERATFALQRYRLGVTCPKDEWFHFALVGYEEGGVQKGRYYINGVEKTTSSLNTNVIGTNNTVLIGEYAGTYFNFKIDQIGFWKSALSTANIQALYAGGDITKAPKVEDVDSSNLGQGFNNEEGTGATSADSVVGG